MSHPPIPKSRFFSQYADGSADFRTTERFDRIRKCTCHAEGQWRLVMAAVAEVEWRKRAERWEKLYKYFCIRNLVRPRRQILAARCKRAMKLGLIAVTEWREWGSK